MAKIPSIGTTRTATPRRILKTDEHTQFMPGNFVIDATKSRDGGNTGDLDVLRAGLPMLLNISTGYYQSIIGPLAAEYVSGSTSLTLSAGSATLLNKLATSGTFYVVGINGGSPDGIDYVEFDYSSVNTTTGVVTVTAETAQFSSGTAWAVDTNCVVTSDLDATIGLSSPILLEDEFGIKVTDVDSVDENQNLSRLLVGGMIDSSQILGYPTGSGLQDEAFKEYIKSQLQSMTNLVFDDDFMV